MVIITGFLGSGKTSLIADQLDGSQDDLAVIVHDLGEENIDVAFLKGGEHVSLTSNTRIRSVSSGYLTSSHLDQLTREIDALSDLEPRPMAILVETSGAANVVPVIEKLRAPGESWELISVLTVLDSSVIGDYREDPSIAPLLETQALSASLLILNKWDRANRIQRKHAKTFADYIRSKNGSDLETTKFGRIKLRLLLTRRLIPGKSSLPEANTRESIESFHLTTRRPFHPERLERWLDTSWTGIIRVKGFVWIASDMEGIYVLDAAGSQREVGLEGTWYASVADDELRDDPEVQKLVKEHPFGDRRQALTIIGRPESIAQAKNELEAALLRDDEMAIGPEGWQSFPDPLTGKFT